MTALAFALFPTAIGVCGLAWSEAGVTAVSFPERNDAATRARLARKAPGAAEIEPPAWVAEAVAAVQTLLKTGRADLTGIAVDLTGADDFERRVLEAARHIPAGATATYGALAAEVRAPGAARAVGVAMARNPCPIIIPCHRVLAAGGGFGGFSAPGGLESKARLLTIERAVTLPAPSLFDDLPISVRPSGSG